MHFVLLFFSLGICLITRIRPHRRMARGQQKIQSQAKAAEKAAKVKKQQGHSANEQKKAAQKALVHVCIVCKAQMPDPKTYKQHFENKHPKNDLPEDLKNI
ncbi:zinc finger protein 706-like isoform X1 [Bombus pyrosoma]|uniref:zinc finger protein 706-like isoform X1 n=1 Tax=Bombus pyrosoma TaxID=396416 RepID=UPI001CB8ED3B|nr:zinc finger protein 706-like isoform X1 [Bombus pyrosoma]